jgi:hypothetical protein
MGEVSAAGEAMEDEGEVALLRFLLEHASDIGIGLARVDNERQAGLARSGDVGSEALLLHIARAVVIVIVEPSLADRDNFWVARKLD